jgi:hypothetical protein
VVVVVEALAPGHGESGTSPPAIDIRHTAVAELASTVSPEGAP